MYADRLGQLKGMRTEDMDSRFIPYLPLLPPRPLPQRDFQASVWGGRKALARLQDLLVKLETWATAESLEHTWLPMLASWARLFLGS